MYKILRFLPLLFLAPTLGWADLRLPKNPTVFEKFGRGIANGTLAVSEVFDSVYVGIDEKGGTYGYTVGLTQGISRLFMDTAVGALEVATFYIPTKSMKSPAHDTGQVEPMPPADLENWY